MWSQPTLQDDFLLHQLVGHPSTAERLQHEGSLALAYGARVAMMH